MATIFCLIVCLLLPAIIHQPTEAASEIDRNRVLMAYNSEYDHCKGIDASSGTTAKASADKMCEQAFESLDNLKRNSCAGWRLPECRLVSKNDKHYQCSCQISTCNELGVKKNKVTSFRDCAQNLQRLEVDTGVAPAPTADFRQVRDNYDEPMQDALLRRTLSFYGQGILSSIDSYSGEVGGASTAYAGSEYTGDAYTGASYTGGAYTGSSHTGGAYSGGAYSGSVFIGGEGSYRAAQVFDPYGSPSIAHLPPSPEQSKGGVKRKRGSGGYKCHECGKSYALKRILTAHEISHTTLETYCADCKRTFASKASFKSHMSRRHPNKAKSVAAIPKNERPGEGPDGSRFECIECGKTYASERILKEHVKCHKTLQTHCFNCDQTFASRSGYRDHMLTRHPEEAAAETEAVKERRALERPVKCDLCDARFKNNRSLKEHKKRHAGKTKCDICGQELSRVSALRVHKKQIHNIK